MLTDVMLDANVLSLCLFLWQHWVMMMMIRDAGSKFDDYSISPKVRQILLHWGYELTKKGFLNELTS